MQGKGACSAKHHQTHTPLIIFGAALNPDGSPTETLRNRVSAALHFGELTKTVLYIPTGGVPQNGQTEARIMRTLLEAQRDSASIIIEENTASDTFDSIKACSAMLYALGYSSKTLIYFATSPYHTPRCWLLLRLAGWQPKAVPYPFPHFAQAARSKALYLVLHEVLATAWDSLLVLLWRIVR